ALARGFALSSATSYYGGSQLGPTARRHEPCCRCDPGPPFTTEASMSKSPGHQKWPEHKVIETPVDKRVTVELDGKVVADSRDVIRIDEDGSPARYYFPRTDVSMDKLQRTATTSQCPFKGVAHYFSLAHDDGSGGG